MFAAAATGAVGPVAASGSTQSSVSAFISCPATISFDSPGGAGSCLYGDFTGVYTGVSQTVGSTQDSVFYMASATGQVGVNYTLTDLTSGKVLLKWLAAGSISGGTCSSPSAVVPSSPSANSTYYVISSGDVINSGDTLKIHLVWTSFSGSGSPTFCSGGSGPTLISISTTVATGSAPPVLANRLRAGTPHQTTLAGYTGVVQTYFNTGTANFTAVVLGVLKDSSGRTVDVLAASIVATPNANVTAFLVFKQYPSGSYSMTVFATTNQYVPVSSAAVAPVSV
jgi:hypothetical protein